MTTATSTPAPTATPRPVQTCSGAYFRFDAPKDWLRVDVDGGVYLYPDPNDTDHTCLSYQEVPNDMNLSETMVDIALLFSSKEAITAMVEGALTSSGITGFTLSPVEFRGRVIAYGDAKGRYLPTEPPFLSVFFQKGGIMTLIEDDPAWPYDAVGRWALQGRRILLVEKDGDFLTGTVFVSDARMTRSELSSVFHP